MLINSKLLFLPFSSHSPFSNILKALNVPKNENSTESMGPREMGSVKDGVFYSFFQDAMDSVTVFSSMFLVFSVQP